MYTYRVNAWLHHYLPQAFLLFSLVMLSYTSVQFYQSYSGKKVVKAVALTNFRSVDRIPVMRINGKTIGVLAIQKGTKNRRPMVWIRNVQTQEIKKFKVGQNIFKTNVTVAGIRKSRIELESKSGIHHLLLHK
jgi:hypothetical protein